MPDVNAGFNEGIDGGVTGSKVDKRGKTELLDKQELGFNNFEQIENSERGFWTRDGIDVLFFLLIKWVLNIGDDEVKGVGLRAVDLGDNNILIIWFKIAWLWPDNVEGIDVGAGTGTDAGNSSVTFDESASKVGSETFSETDAKVDVETISKFVFKVDDGTSSGFVILGRGNELHGKPGNILGKPKPEPKISVQGLECWGIVCSGFKTEGTAFLSNADGKSEDGAIEVSLEPSNPVLSIFLSNVGVMVEHGGIFVGLEPCKPVDSEHVNGYFCKNVKSFIKPFKCARL